jgi:2-haloacid dehalogenase
MGNAKQQVQALLFDVFGTVVDWRGSLIRELTAFGSARGFKHDWAKFADEWRGLYQPGMEEVRSGRRAWTILDVLHRESLLTLLDQYDMKGLGEHEIHHLVTIWHRLDPWPDAVGGLMRLKTRYIIGTLSNGNIGMMARMAKRGRLPWDVILGAEPARAYKPLPEAYRRNAEMLNLAPHEVMLVAAHNGDLAAAAKVGLRTAFVVRPEEHGPGQTIDLAASQDWDVVTNSFHGVANAMGVPLLPGHG